MEPEKDLVSVPVPKLRVRADGRGPGGAGVVRVRAGAREWVRRSRRLRQHPRRPRLPRTGLEAGRRRLHHAEDWRLPTARFPAPGRRVPCLRARPAGLSCDQPGRARPERGGALRARADCARAMESGRWCARIRGRCTIATGLAVAWFAAHPARAEPVAWVTAQLYLPCALFEMLAVLAYLRAHPPGGAARRGLWLAGSYALAFIAMLFMPGAVCLPFLFLILDAALLDRLDFGADSAAGRIRRAAGLVAEKLPLLGLAIALMRRGLLGEAVEPGREATGVRQPVGPAGAGGVWRLAVPGQDGRTVRAERLYPRPEGGDFRAPVYAAAVIGVVVVSAAVVALRKRVRWLPVVWAAYLLVLAPHLGLIRVGQTIASDRYTYFASILWVLPLAGGLAWLGRFRAGRSGSRPWPRAWPWSLASRPSHGRRRGPGTTPSRSGSRP